MTALVEAALADGACGASSGLEYTPGAFASQDELDRALPPARPRAGLPYATHMRNEDDRLLDAIARGGRRRRGRRLSAPDLAPQDAGPAQLGASSTTAFALIDGAARARARRDVRPLPVRRLRHRPDEHLPRLEPRRRHRGVPRSPRRPARPRRASARRVAREDRADRRVGQRPDLRRRAAVRARGGGKAARRLRREPRSGPVRRGGRAARGAAATSAWSASR